MKLLPDRPLRLDDHDERPAPLEALEPRELLSGGPQILTVGDSITWGSPNPDQSYRRELDGAIAKRGVDAEFVGSRSDGRGFDNDHYSQPGIQATVSRPGNGGVWRGSLNDGFRSGSVLQRGEKPDLILLHIGTNTIDENRSSVDNAAGQLATLLNTMADRWRRGEFASDVKVLVADIIPGGRGDRSGSGYRLDTDRLENSRSYNAKIGQVISRLGDRGFAAKIQRIDLARIDASGLDRSAFSSSELRAIDNDGDRWVDWFNGVDEGGSQRGARGNNAAVMSDDLLHPTALGYRVLGQAWFNAVADSGKLPGRTPSARPTPTPTPGPKPTPTPVGKPALSGASSAARGQPYRLGLEANGVGVSEWYVNWGDGSPSQWLKGTDSVTHPFSGSGDKTVRSFVVTGGKRVGLGALTVAVTAGTTPSTPTRPASPNATPAPTPKPAPKPAPTPKAPGGGVAIAGAGTAVVGQPYELRLGAGGLGAVSWYVSWGDGSRGQWIKNTDRVTHTFTGTSKERVIRAFAESGGRRIGAAPVRVRVDRTGASAPAPTPRPSPTPTPTAGAPAAGDGRVTRSYWTGIGGSTLRDLTGSSAYPGRPTGTTTLDRLRSGDWNNPRDNVNYGSNYGERITGFLIAPRTGEYRFWISGDDQASFRLSTDRSTSRLRDVARVDGWTKPLEWDKRSGQKSAGVYLVAGRSYALEVLHKEATGGDHVAVGWRTPDHGGGSGPAEVIGSRHLSRYAV